MAVAFQIAASDNVATLLTDVEQGVQVQVRGEGNGGELAAREPIRIGHKIAIQDLAPGDAVIKYGHIIGEITVAVRSGDWIHLHNCHSRYDAASSELSVDSGERSSTRYA